MSPLSLLVVYCLVILLASLAGGLVPALVRLTHRRLEFALSFVSGVMLGVALMHMLPHALLEYGAARAEQADHGVADLDHAVLDPAMLWLVAGFLVMFVIERFFSFHHHDAPVAEDGCHEAVDSRPHGHRLTWAGAAIGLVLHTLIAGVALAASVQSEVAHDHGGATLAGMGTFLVIALHKPFDALTIGTLMAAGGRSVAARHLVNILFSLTIPLGVILFYLPVSQAAEPPHQLVGGALAFSAGTFLCIALSDLLPELHFHRHDRVKLTAALLLGVVLAWGIGPLEGGGHDRHSHTHGATSLPEQSRKVSKSKSQDVERPVRLDVRLGA